MKDNIEVTKSSAGEKTPVNRTKQTVLLVALLGIASVLIPGALAAVPALAQTGGAGATATAAKSGDDATAASGSTSNGPSTSGSQNNSYASSGNLDDVAHAAGMEGVFGTIPPLSSVSPYGRETPVGRGGGEYLVTADGIVHITSVGSNHNKEITTVQKNSDGNVVVFTIEFDDKGNLISQDSRTISPNHLTLRLSQTDASGASVTTVFTVSGTLKLTISSPDSLGVQKYETTFTPFPSDTNPYLIPPSASVSGVITPGSDLPYGSKENEIESLLDRWSKGAPSDAVWTTPSVGPNAQGAPGTSDAERPFNISDLDNGRFDEPDSEKKSDAVPAPDATEHSSAIAPSNNARTCLSVSACPPPVLVQSPASLLGPGVQLGVTGEGGGSFIGQNPSLYHGAPFWGVHFGVNLPIGGSFVFVPGAEVEDELTNEVASVGNRTAGPTLTTFETGTVRIRDGVIDGAVGFHAGGWRIQGGPELVIGNLQSKTVSGSCGGTLGPNCVTFSSTSSDVTVARLGVSADFGHTLFHIRDEVVVTGVRYQGQRYNAEGIGWAHTVAGYVGVEFGH